VDLRLWLSEVRNASITMKFSFWDDELRVVAEGMQRGIFVEMETMRPRRLSSEEKALFLPYLDETVTPIPSCWMD
jgi:acyl-CoA thioester hydrolase